MLVGEHKKSGETFCVCHGWAFWEVVVGERCGLHHSPIGLFFKQLHHKSEQDEEEKDSGEKE
jgi:hypothetical protein